MRVGEKDLSLLSQVSAALLAPNDLDEGRLQQLLGSLMSHEVGVRRPLFPAQLARVPGCWRTARQGRQLQHRSGVGYAPSAARRPASPTRTNLSLLALQQSVTAARGIAAAGAQGKVRPGARTEANLLYPAMDPCRPSTSSRKIALLEQMDRFARGLIPPSIR